MLVFVQLLLGRAPVSNSNSLGLASVSQKCSQTYLDDVQRLKGAPLSL